MTSKTRRSKYKGTKWINTRYAKPYKIRRAIRSTQCAALAYSSLARINVIRSVNSDTQQEKVAKAISIAQEILEFNVQLIKLNPIDRAINNAFFEHGIMNHKAGDTKCC